MTGTAPTVRWGNRRGSSAQGQVTPVVFGVETNMGPPRIELLRQRALAQGVLNVDEGPVEENLVRLEAERSGVSYEALCDTIEELLDGDDPWTPTS